jgi:hypothetical protein
MMRIAAAVLAGAVVALLTCFSTVHVVTTSQNEPVTKTIYNYGTR